MKSIAAIFYFYSGSRLGREGNLDQRGEGWFLSPFPAPTLTPNQIWLGINVDLPSCNKTLTLQTRKKVTSSFCQSYLGVLYVFALSCFFSCFCSFLSVCQFIFSSVKLASKIYTVFGHLEGRSPKLERRVKYQITLEAKPCLPGDETYRPCCPVQDPLKFF